MAGDYLNDCLKLVIKIILCIRGGVEGGSIHANGVDSPISYKKS